MLASHLPVFYINVLMAKLAIIRIVIVSINESLIIKALVYIKILIYKSSV